MNITEKKWHETHAKNIRKRERTRPERLRRRRLGLQIIRERSSMRFHMVVPENMNILTNHDETVGFINLIKENIFTNDVFVFLDFSKCKDISSETCVVLAAAIDRCRRLLPESVTGSYPQDAAVYFMLNEMGFFNLLQVRSSEPVFDKIEEVDVVKLAWGKKNKNIKDHPEHLIKPMKSLFYSEDGLKPKSPYSRKIYSALTEAMGNAVEHAYSEEFVSNNKKTCLPIWWRAGFKFNDTENVLMVIYDQGAGMPNTINTTLTEKISEFIAKASRVPHDGEKLEIAMEKGRSRTRVKGRGQGSYDMQQIIRESTNSCLNIVSYQGKYEYNNDGSWLKSSLNTPLEGTLIIWSICLKTIASEIYEADYD